jgi:hypothetical protein
MDEISLQNENTDALYRRAGCAQESGYIGMDTTEEYKIFRLAAITRSLAISIDFIMYLCADDAAFSRWSPPLPPL